MSVKSKLACILGFIVIIWIVEIFNGFVGHRLNLWGIYPRTWGIYPRTISGLIGIPIAPFLHGGLGHIISNTIPFLILGSLVSLRGSTRWIGVSLVIVLFGGLGVWLIGRPAVHVGASGLVFGYFGYLVASGWYDRKISSALISIAVIIFYGGMLFGALPTKGFISWEAHLSGLISGILVARLMRQGKVNRKK